MYVLCNDSQGCSGGHFKKGIRTTMRAFKASCNIISDRRRGGCSPRACVAGKTMHHMCERRRRGIGGGAGSSACLLACLDASISCRIPLES